LIKFISDLQKLKKWDENKVQRHLFWRPQFSKAMTEGAEAPDRLHGNVLVVG